MSQDPGSGSVAEPKDVTGRPHKLIKGGLLNKSNLGSCPICKVQVCGEFPCKKCGFHPNTKVPGIHLSTDLDTLSFAKWCSFLTTSVLRTRTPFSIFLRATLHLERSMVASSSPAFPLPLPFPGVFAKMPPGLSAAKRRRCHFRRALHVLIMALNYWWSGSNFIPMEFLERAPSLCQQRIFRRLASLMLADGPRESFETLRSGRRFPQLVARLSELSDAVTKLGAGASAYDKTFAGHEVPLDNSRFEELEPYRSLNASRLKVVGEGLLDATPYLSPELCMAYRFPDALLMDRIPKAFEYSQKLDLVEEVVALAKVWDARGLLHIHDVDVQKCARHELVRVFNCLKNAQCDRQIGDRRGRNAVEMRIAGPSSNLPTGADLLDLVIDPKLETLSIICTDRKDFYHQFATSANRTIANTVGPRIPLDLLRDTEALKAFASAKNAKKPSRLVGGDGLGFSSRQSFTRCPDGFVMASFKSIFQGDHAGVEIATCAHEGILRSAGLLQDECRIEGSRPFRGQNICEGLVIDDYFAIAKVRHGLLVDPAVERFKSCKEVYASLGILGSDDKDVCGARKAKVIGASVDASPGCQDRGHVLIAAPAAKRYALSWITLQLCQLTHTTDALHLCVLGGWTSILLFRRPFMSLLQKAFHVVDVSTFVASNPKLVPLSRPVVTELVLLSILAPLCVSDIAVGFCDRLFATDASLAKGAIVSSEVSQQVIESLWRTCRSKGGYSKLLTPVQSLLSRCVDFEEIEQHADEVVKRPLAFRFDFIEVFAGAATVTAHMAAKGFSVGCPIDLSRDPELDMTKVHVLEWLLHLVMNQYVKAVMVEPPCTTFSIMRKPPLRSKLFPYGFDLMDPQTQIGTLLGYRAFQILKVGARCGITVVLENPWSSMIKNLPPWEELLGHPECELVRCDSCAYGSPHLKAFAFLCVWADTSFISLRCSGGHSHVPVQGALTKKSAIYVNDLAEALANVMESGIIRLARFEKELVPEDALGLESQLINELALSSTWTCDAVWNFRITAHINLLELEAVVRLVGRLIAKGISKRVVVLVDSNVIKCAASKGRSSSRALARALAKLAVLSIAGGLYLVFGFCPTRLNPADDPTREVELRGSIPGMDFAAWDRLDLYRLASLPKMRRWASNWVRLVLCLLGPAGLGLTDRSVHRVPPFPYGLHVAASAPPGVKTVPPSMDFDSTLGYPGEGPPHLTCFGLPWSRALFLVMFCFLRLTHGVLVPRNAGDIQRLSLRNQRPPLPEGRPVLGITSQLRVSHLEQFKSWLFSLGISLDDMLEQHFTRIDELNKNLVRYGRALYASGRPYNHFAETINAVASLKPVVRRQLQEAWNLAFAWQRDEPSVHHIAMPWQILLGAISTCLFWGWLDMAGMLALSWGALLRVGEFLQATRRDLLLPVDTNYTNKFALLALREPKTRFTAARHQSAKLDIPDLLRVVHLAFAHLQPWQKLWSKSAQTLRSRFRDLLCELGIQSLRMNGKTLDLGSLRPGGATWILQQTEDSEFTRRRGRWINQRVMEIYIQEISSFQYLSIVPHNCRMKIYALCDSFLATLEGAETFKSAEIPLTVWFLVWQGQVNRK